MTATHKKAFTLIELLVVISIIALLVGILLPALGAARESARGVVCQTHMKNLSTAFIAYGTDNQGWWPSWASGDAKAVNLLPRNTWVPSGFLHNANGTEPYQKDLADGALWTYTPDYGVFRCPSDEYYQYSMGLSYSLSHLITAAPRPNFPGTNVEPATIVTVAGEGDYRYPQSDKFVEPSNLIFLIDEGGPINGNISLGVNDGYFENMDVNVPATYTGIGFPQFPDLPGAYTGDGDKSKWYHAGGAAFAFADGHGEIRKRSDKEIYTYQRQYVGRNNNRVFGYSRIWDPAAQAPIIATEP